MTISPFMSQSRSGRYIDFANPHPDQFTIEDIAFGLARECRFNGQTSMYYSVATHSVLVSLVVPKEYALIALMHDGSEAFMRDICTPLKRLIPDYRKIEDQMQQAIYASVGLTDVTDDLYKVIKAADERMFLTENAQLMTHHRTDFPGIQQTEPYPIKIRELGDKEACFYFLDRYVSIINDTPFVKERDLWQAQQNEFIQRAGQTEYLGHNGSSATRQHPKAA